MATGNIKGIVIEIGGNTEPLQKALRNVDNETKNVQKELKQVDNLLKFDSSNIELLQQKQKLLGDAIGSTTTRLDSLKQAQSEVERQFQSGEIGEEAYRKFQREIIATEGKLKAFQSQADAVKVKIDAQTDTSGLDKMTDKLEEVGKKAQEVGGKMKDVGGEMSTKLSAPIAAFGGGALLAAGQFDNAMGQIQAALGVTADEAAALEDKASNVWKQGFGESLEEVADAIIRVKQNFKDLDDGEVEQVTKNSLALAKSFDSDVNEVTRAAGNIMTNFGISAEEAFDMMANGAQNGLNFSNEMFDNLAEYAPLWSDMGFSAEEMFSILEAGAKEGVYNLDYLNDVMKEFQIRATDGSKSTTDAVSELGPEVEKVWKAFSKGEATVADMSQAAVAELATIDDKVKQNELGVALFGTKWEDLGGDVVLSMLQAEQSLEGFEGAMNSVSQAQEQTFGQRWESFIRTATASLEPLGKILLDLAEQWLPRIIAVVESLATWFSNLSPVMQGVTVAIGAVVAAIGPFLVVAGMIASAIGNLIPIFLKLLPVIKTAGTAILGISAPVAIAIAAVAALIAIGVALYKNWDEVSAWLKKTWETIKSNASSAFKQMGDSISKAWESVKSSTTSAWNAVKSALDAAWNAIKNATTTTFNSVKTSITNVWDSIKSTLTSLWDGLKSTATSVFNAIKSAIETVWNAVKKFTTDTWDAIKSSLSSLWNGLKSTATSSFNDIKKAITDVWNNIKTFTNETWAAMKSKISGVAGEILSTVRDKFNDIKNKITDPIKQAKETISAIVDDIKGFFSNMNLKIPDIKLPKLPKFTLTGDFSLNPPSVPKIGISWNALGGIFNKPTIFNTANAGLQGVGEAGPEAILPLNAKTLAGIGKGIAEQMNLGSPSTIDNSKYMQPQIHITVQGGNMSASEIARKALQTQRQLAMEWGV